LPIYGRLSLDLFKGSGNLLLKALAIDIIDICV
jgi:hypothetical protein